MSSLANSIDEVIIRLDTIIEDCIKKSSRLGYFAILYKQVTIGVKNAIKNGYFDDGLRMEELDVVFANRYLNAYYQYAQQIKPTQSWYKTFESYKLQNLTIIQHILLGMNAHINLDLGIAAAQISNANNIYQLENDFNKINNILSTSYNSILPKLKKISWPIVLLGEINPTLTSKIVNFSIEKARNQAWANAILLSEVGVTNINEVNNLTDIVISKVADAIQNPSWITSRILSMIKACESNDVTSNLKQFNN